MSEKEKTILENLSKSLSKASESQKEYLLGLADGMALMAEGKKKSNRRAKPNKQVTAMGCIITIHHPILDKDEKDIRVEQIKKRTIEYMKEVHAQRRTNNEEKNKN